MASREFNARFRSTCSISPGSSFTSPAPASSAVIIPMPLPTTGTSIRISFSTTWFRPRRSWESVCGLPTLNNWSTSSVARPAAAIISCKSARHGWPASSASTAALVSTRLLRRRMS